MSIYDRIISWSGKITRQSAENVGSGLMSAWNTITDEIDASAAPVTRSLPWMAAETMVFAGRILRIVSNTTIRIGETMVPIATAVDTQSGESVSLLGVFGESFFAPVAVSMIRALADGTAEVVTAIGETTKTNIDALERLAKTASPAIVATSWIVTAIIVIATIGGGYLLWKKA